MPTKSTKDAAIDTRDREIVSTRMFDVPPATLFQAWSDPALLSQWWGPKGFTNTFHEFSFRPDGLWHFTMHSPDGTDYENRIVFVEINNPQRNVLRHLEPMHEFLTTVTVEKLDTKTRLSWHMLFTSAEECKRVKPYILQANEQNFDRLATVLQTLR